MLYWSYQLNEINQRGKVWVGLVLLNDGGTQCFTCTLYEDLGKEKSLLLYHFTRVSPSVFHHFCLSQFPDLFF